MHNHKPKGSSKCNTDTRTGSERETRDIGRERERERATGVLELQEPKELTACPALSVAGRLCGDQGRSTEAFPTEID